MRCYLLVAVIAILPSMANAVDCPFGSHPWVDQWGNQICKRFTDGSTSAVQGSLDNCPFGSHPWVDQWGTRTCKSFSGNRQLYDTSQGCPMGTHPWVDTWGNQVASNSRSNPRHARDKRSHCHLYRARRLRSGTGSQGDRDGRWARQGYVVSCTPDRENLSRALMSTSGPRYPGPMAGAAANMPPPQPNWGACLAQAGELCGTRGYETFERHPSGSMVIQCRGQ